MQTTKDFNDQIQQFYLELAQNKSLDQQRKTNLELQLQEIDTYINMISNSISDSNFQTISSKIEKTIGNCEGKINLFIKYSSNLLENESTPLQSGSIISLIKQVTKRNNVPQSILNEIEQLLYKLSSQSIDSVKKIRQEIENDKEREKLPSLINDLQRSTNMNKANLSKLKERNMIIMSSYNEKMEFLNKNLLKLQDIEHKLLEKKEKLNQLENIDNLLNQEILSWNFNLEYLKESSIKIEEIPLNNRIVRKFSVEKDSYLKVLSEEVKKLKKELNNAESYYEDIIGVYLKAQKGAKSLENVSQLESNYCTFIFYALFLKIIKNRIKKRKNDIELITTVNEHLINMVISFERLFNLDNKLTGLKEAHENINKRGEKLGKLNDKYRFILLKRFEVYEY